MSELIKLYGERNTNTNYLEKLIELNLEAKQLIGVVPSSIRRLQENLPGDEWLKDVYFKYSYSQNLGWKHCLVDSAANLMQFKSMRPDNLHYIALVKNPYSWLLSLHRRPYHHGDSAKQSFAEFLASPWKTVGRELSPSIVESPIQLWNLKNKAYLNIEATEGLVISSESIFFDPEEVINKIVNVFKLEKKSSTFVNYNKSTKDSSKDFQYYRNYYLLEKWRKEISDDDIAYISRHLDVELMAKLSYDVI
jgi:hypothetical protein